MKRSETNVKSRVKCPGSDRVPYVDAVVGRDALEVVLAIYKSQKAGLLVQLPLEDFASVDMAGEF